MPKKNERLANTIINHNGMEFRGLRKLNVSGRIYLIGEYNTSLDTRRYEWTTVLVNPKDLRDILCRAPLGEKKDAKYMLRKHLRENQELQTLLSTIQDVPLTDVSNFFPGGGVTMEDIK